MVSLLGLSKSEFNNTILERFSRQCSDIDSNGCITWLGTKTKKHYGLIRLAGRDSKKTTAHRVSWVLKHGDIPPHILVLHKCDNPECVNVDHLFIGTAKQNTDDMVSKSRHSWKCGTPWQKLNQSDVNKVRELRKSGYTQQNVANLFGVSRPLISLIENGKIKHSSTTAHAV